MCRQVPLNYFYLILNFSNKVVKKFYFNTEVPTEKN